MDIIGDRCGPDSYSGIRDPTKKRFDLIESNAMTSGCVGEDNGSSDRINQEVSVEFARGPVPKLRAEEFQLTVRRH